MWGDSVRQPIRRPMAHETVQTEEGGEVAAGPSTPWNLYVVTVDWGCLPFLDVRMGGRALTQAAN